eukprot:CAMPEP_0203649506 /NCGR_PEP_ID=MMETSP0088-20131115/22024_1 /ASSEMBLY_ACC=CAM_ASM_001087 /TAXON_ID=426623 /ORGANISM="Chaetoceros affinis, Strain CCMP159" /LENGTH=84 /DNA_ID=CAMNT_0050507943 /DNA_START=26 /DNA_END=276 /DNA_ORIENTATION=-
MGKEPSPFLLDGLLEVRGGSDETEDAEAGQVSDQVVEHSEEIVVEAAQPTVIETAINTATPTPATAESSAPAMNPKLQNAIERT